VLRASPQRVGNEPAQRSRKLNQIVEQAQLTLQDPESLTSERQRLIIALARFISAEMSHPSRTAPAWTASPAPSRKPDRAQPVPCSL
jgi:hypothetical protein